MKPLLCNYYVTLRCNARCEFCNIWRDPSDIDRKDASLADIDKNLRELKAIGVRAVDFTGGEPLLYRNIVEALRLAKRYGLYTTITTNCLLYPSYATELDGLVDVLQFSLDSTDEHTHNKIRGVKSYHKVMESIAIAKSRRQKISLLHTVTDENVQALPDMVSFAQRNRCVLCLNPCFEYFENKAISSRSIPILKQYFREPYVVMDLGFLKFVEGGGNNIHHPQCKAMSSTVVISPDNFLLLPCYHHAFKRIKITGSLAEIYRSLEVRELIKKEGTFSFCANCQIYCYMRTSLFSRYPYLSVRSMVKYVIERSRKQF
jgi:MoaA/NifB/PqqE/SkfB family radical SAM enzyme